MSSEKFSFNLLNEDSLSRTGRIFTHRGYIDTPTFMPVGTQATIKSAFIVNLDKKVNFKNNEKINIKIERFTMHEAVVLDY